MMITHLEINEIQIHFRNVKSITQAAIIQTEAHTNAQLINEKLNPK